jgi:hypothetical protein
MANLRTSVSVAVCTAFAGATIVWLAAGSLTAQGDAEHAKLKNPVMSTPDSIAAGKALFTKTCAPCHGVNATGGSGNDISPPSPDLTDTEWQHGGTDGSEHGAIRPAAQGRRYLEYRELPEEHREEIEVPGARAGCGARARCTCTPCTLPPAFDRYLASGFGLTWNL